MRDVKFADDHSILVLFRIDGMYTEHLHNLTLPSTLSHTHTRGLGKTRSDFSQ